MAGTSPLWRLPKGPSCSRDPPKSAQVRQKGRPRAPRSVQRAASDVPRCARDAPRRSQDASRRFQNASERARGWFFVYFLWKNASKWLPKIHQKSIWEPEVRNGSGITKTIIFSIKCLFFKSENIQKMTNKMHPKVALSGTESLKRFDGPKGRFWNASKDSKDASGRSTAFLDVPEMSTRRPRDVPKTSPTCTNSSLRRYAGASKRSQDVSIWLQDALKTS